MRYKKLRPNFYSAHLNTGKLDLKPNHTAHFFFVVENSNDKEYMRQQARELLLTPGLWFEFYGRYRNEWELAFDEMDIMLHPNMDEEEIAMTSSWTDLDSFVDTLDLALETRSIVLCDIYLLYDDEDIYKQIIEKLP